MKTLATAPTEERLIKMISQFFMGSTITIKDGKVYNSKGLINGFETKQKGKRYLFIQTAK